MNKMWSYVFYSLTVVGLFFFVGSQSSQGLVMLYKYYYQKEKSVPRSILKTSQAVFWVGYLLAYQACVKNVEKLEKEMHDVHYILGNKNYKIRVKSKRGPRQKKILQVIDHESNDITPEISSYMGPSEDWHGILYTPEHFSCDQLTFHLSSGQVLTFERNDPIILITQKEVNELVQSICQK